MRERPRRQQTAEGGDAIAKDIGLLVEAPDVQAAPAAKRRKSAAAPKASAAAAALQQDVAALQQDESPAGVRDAVEQMIIQRTEAIQRATSQALGAAGSCASNLDYLGLNWQGYEQLKQAALEDQRQQQHHQLTLEGVMSTLRQVAAGRLRPSPELVRQIQQQEVLLPEPELQAEYGTYSTGSGNSAAAGSGSEQDDGPANVPAAAAAVVVVEQQHVIGQLQPLQQQEQQESNAAARVIIQQIAEQQQQQMQLLQRLHGVFTQQQQQQQRTPSALQIQPHPQLAAVQQAMQLQQQQQQLLQQLQRMCSAGQVQQQQQRSLEIQQALRTAAAVAAAASNLDAAAAAPSSSAAAAGSGMQQLAAVQPISTGQGKVSAVKIGFPDLSQHSSIEDLAKWYYVNALGNTGKMPQQLEAAGAGDGYSWRGGQQHRPQRWAEYVQLLKASEAARDRLSEQARKASQRPHCLARVEPVAAARELDEQRALLWLSVCEYREFLNHTVKGFKKGRAAAAELPMEQWGQLPPELQAELKEAQQVAAG